MKSLEEIEIELLKHQVKIWKDRYGVLWSTMHLNGTKGLLSPSERHTFDRWSEESKDEIPH